MINNFNRKKPPIIMFMEYDVNDNNKFVSDMASALVWLNKKGKKISPKNISKYGNYPIGEIKLNLDEIGKIMDALGIE